MGLVQHKLQFSSTSSSGIAALTGTDTEGANTNGEINGYSQFSANSNNAAVSPFSFNGTKLQDVFLVCSQNATLYTNGSNANSVTLTAGIPFVWGTSMPTGAPYPSNPWNGVNTVNSAALTCNAACSFKWLLGSL